MGIHQDLQEFMGMYDDSQEFIKICVDSLKFVWPSWEMSLNLINLHVLAGCPLWSQKPRNG